MKILMFGSGGFVGKNVSEILRADGHEVVDTYRNAGDRPGYSVDLLDAEAVGDVLEQVQPEIVINCAGVVQNNEAAAANPIHSANILSQVVGRHISLQRIVVLGSAAEYGVVQPGESPVKEDTPLRATAPYGLSKVDEVATALTYKHDSGLPVVVARVFNPIGPGMPSQQLVPRLLDQIGQIEAGKRQAIEISRQDSERDYVDIRDTAAAIALLATGPLPGQDVYNVGSGRATSNGKLVELLFNELALAERPAIIETMDQPEPTYAAQADISRLGDEYGWYPKIPIEQTVKDIINDLRK